MFRFFLYSAIILFSALATACGGDSDDTPAPPVEKVNRTVLVYMVADNSLGDSGLDIADMQEMIEAAGNEGFNGGRLLVYWNCNATADGYPPRLLEIHPEGAEVLKIYPDDVKLTSVDPDRFRQVIADLKSYAPAADYGLVMWSHANGWLGAPAGTSTDRYRAFGEDRGYHITIPSLAKALSGNTFRFIYFDCCLMGNIESVYELRSLTDVIVAAPTDLGVEGMPYQLNAPLFFLPEPDMNKAAANTFEWYSSRGRECQIAVYDLTRLEPLVRATSAIFAGLTAYPQGVNSLQRYVKPGIVCHSYDMEQYMALLSGGVCPPAWRSALDGFITYSASTEWGIGSLRMETFCGLGSFAIRTPADIEYRGYNTLAWWRDVVSAAPAYKN